MINSVTLTGRLTKDPDLKYSPSGVAITSFTIAVNRTFQNQQGEREADFINCVCFKRVAENLANYQKKGNLIGIEGRIQTRSYDDNNGNKRYVTEVVANNVHFLESKRQDNSQLENQSEPMDVKPEDLPF